MLALKNFFFRKRNGHSALNQKRSFLELFQSDCFSVLLNNVSWKLKSGEHELIEKLGKRERSIIKFLKESSGSCSLASIRMQTGIPNTTLHRIIRKLERINIVLTVKIKKIRVVILKK